MIDKPETKKDNNNYSTSNNW